MIRFENAGHVFQDGSRALGDLAFEIGGDELVLVCGANGSGKTTLLRMMNGLLPATEGRVLVDGNDAHGSPIAVRTTVGLVFQDPDAQIIGESVAEDVAFGPRNLDLDDEEIARRVETALASVGLAHLAERPCHLLSGGEKRRLGIAGVLAMEPRVLALDEPFANLDWPGTRDVVSRLEHLRTAGHAVVVACHELDPLVHLAPRVILLARGRIVRDGPLEDVLPHLEDHGVRRPAPPPETGP